MTFTSMKRRFLHKFIWVLLLHCIHAHIESSHVNSTASERELTRKMSKSSQTKTKFADLNSDVLYQISNELNVAGLLNMVRSNSKLASGADDQFWRKYKYYNLAIMKMVLSDDTLLSTENKIIECETMKAIEVYDLQSAADLLKFFGQTFRKLRIQNHDIFINHPAIMMKYFRHFGSKVLTNLNLDRIQEDTFRRFVRPFENVEDLSFSVNVSTVKERVPLNLLFPALKRLTLELRSDADYSFIAVEFKQLEHVFISALNRPKEQMSHIEAFLSKNSHLRSIHLVAFFPDLVKSVANLLPKVVNLTLEAAPVKGDEIVQYDSVKHFKLYEQYPTSLKKLSFPQMQTLEMQFSDDMLNDWTAFLQKHKNISRLDVTQVDGQMQLLKLTAQMDNLTDISVECSTFIAMEEIAEFVDEHKKLMKLKIAKFIGFNDTDVSFLREKFGNNWHIHLSDDDSITTLLLERNV